MDRRTSLRLLATASLVPGVSFGQSEPVADTPVADTPAREPAFFTEHEYATVRVLADLVLPADDRSGSASEAGVPEYIDFVMTDQPELQVPMRGGLAWLDAHARRRFGNLFLDLDTAQQHSLLDEIAYPEVATPEVSQGAAFFSQLRDLVAAGFFSSKMGVEDLRYMGNVYVSEWTGCPKEVADRLGVAYEE